MQAAKNMVATVKQKAGSTAAEAEAKKEDTKFAAEEKVDKMKAHGDEGAKDEAAAKRTEREEGAQQHKGAEKSQYADEKERVVNPHPGSIGNKPTPADLDKAMGANNPTNPENPQHPANPSMNSGGGATGLGTGAAGAGMSPAMPTT